MIDTTDHDPAILGHSLGRARGIRRGPWSLSGGWFMLIR